MKRNLLIIGAGIYSLVTREIAQTMGCFEKIAFVDDGATETPDGTPVIGTTKDMASLSAEYSHVVVAIGNAGVRLRLLEKIEEDGMLQPATLISPKAYVSPSAQLGSGCIIEPMAVVHAGCTLGKGCLICAGAVVNHASLCGDCVQVDCNAAVAGNTAVPGGIKVPSGSVFRSETPHVPLSAERQECGFRNGK